MRRPHLVSLSTQALDLLHELKIMTGNYHYVFPGRRDPNKPMSEASINQVIKRIGYGGKVKGHGFRHSLSTILNEQGFDSKWIEVQLAHVGKNNIIEINNNENYISHRKCMMQWYSYNILK